MKKIITALLGIGLAGALCAQSILTGYTATAGQVTPAAPSGGAGVFSSVTDSGLTATRVVFSTTGGLLTDNSAFTFNSGTGALSATGFQGVIGATTPAAGSFTTLSATSNVKISTNNVYLQGVTTAAAAQNLLGIGGDDNTYVFCKPAKKVTVYGTATIADFSDTGLAVTGGGSFSGLGGTGSRAVLADASGVLSAPVSDERLKEPLRPLPESYGLETVLKLQPSIFKYLDKAKWGKQDYIGFGARYTSTFLPEVTGQDVNGNYYMTDEKLTAVLVKAVQQQQEEIRWLWGAVSVLALWCLGLTFRRSNRRSS